MSKDTGRQQGGNLAGVVGAMTALTRLLPHIALLGLLAWHPAQAQVPSDPFNYTRTTSYTYYGPTDGAKGGRLKSETIEPDMPQLATVTSYDYDSSGNRISATTANAPGATGKTLFATRSTSSVYAAVTGQQIRVGNANVNVSIPAGLFATTQTVDPSGLAFSENRSYDPRFGVMLSLKGPNGLTTSWQYDDFGRVTREVRADGTSTVTAYCIIDGQGVDTSSNSSTANGDPLGCFAPPSAELLPDTMMFTHSVPLDANGVAMGPYVRIYTDSLGREIRRVTESFDGSAQTASFAHVPIYADSTYDQFGVKVQQTQPYFANNLSSSTTGSNDVGLTWVQVDALGRSTFVFVADPKGNSTHSSMGYGPNFGTRNVALTRFTYSGQKTITFNDKNQQRIEEKNAIGELAVVTDAAGATLIHQRDAFGNLVKTIDAMSNATVLVYDYRGRKTQLQDPDTGVWNYAYDALGELVWQQSPNQKNAGTQTTMVYDALGRMTSRVEPEYTSTWRYDKNADGSSCMAANPALGIGKLCQSGSSNGVSHQYAYDDKGRPTGNRTTVTNGPSFASAVSYDSNTGRLASQTYPTGVKVTYAYTTRGWLEKLLLGTTAAVAPLPDAQGGRAASVTLAAGSVLWQNRVVSARGQAEQQAYGSDGGGANSVTSKAVFDATGRVTDLTAGLAASPTKVLSQHYNWDSLSNLRGRVDDNGDESGGVSTGAVTESFTYGDALNHLTSYTVSAPAIPNLSRTVDLQYSALGQLMSKSDVGTYGYAASGGGAGSKPHALQSVVGSYNASYGYDLNGNVTSATAGKYRSVSYTSFDQPDSGQGLQGPSGSPKYTWQYDENHARVSETRVNASGTRTTWYVGGNFESETAPSGAVSNRHMLSVGGQVVGVLVSTGALPAASVDITQSPPASVTLVKVEYWHKDYMGSLISTTDHTGAVTARYAYDPFGKRRYTNGSYDAAGNVVVDWSPTLNAGTGNGLASAEQLDDAGVVRMNGRLFDPMLGLFMQPSSSVSDAGNLQSYNRYSYCENNPLTCADPTGLSVMRPLVSAGAIDLVMRRGAMVRVGVQIFTASSGLAFAGGSRPLGLLMCGAMSCAEKVLTNQIQYSAEDIAKFNEYYAALGQAEGARQSAAAQQAADWYRNYNEGLDTSFKMQVYGFAKQQGQITNLKNQLRPLVLAYLVQGGTGGATGFLQWLDDLADSASNESDSGGDRAFLENTVACLGACPLPSGDTKKQDIIRDCSKENCVVNGVKYTSNFAIPGNEPVPVTDATGKAVLDSFGAPMYRPSRANLDDVVDQFKDSPEKIVEFRQGGAWDFQRVKDDSGRFIYTDQYREFANVAIGYGLASQGINWALTSGIANVYAAFKSTYYEPMHPVFFALPKVLIYDYQAGERMWDVNYGVSNPASPPPVLQKTDYSGM